MAKVVLEADDSGALILGASILKNEEPGKRYVVTRNGERLTLQPETTALEEDVLSLAENLEALKAGVLNAIWAADIDRLFTSSPANSIVGRNVFDRGIIRFSQHSALLAFARLFDRHAQAASLPKFLKRACRDAKEFQYATPGKVIATAKEHRTWICRNKSLIDELLEFRSTQIAHLDMSSARSFFDGEIIGVTGWFEPTIVDRAEAMLEEVVEIVAAYVQFHDGKQFDLKEMREQLKTEFEAYVHFRNERDKTTCQL